MLISSTSKLNEHDINIMMQDKQCLLKKIKMYCFDIIYYRLGETCSHVAALLFKVEAAVRLGYTTPACTDVSCRWNNCFTTKILGTQVSKIKFYDPKAKSNIQQGKQRQFAPASTQEQNQLLSSLAKENPNTVGLCAFASYSEKFHQNTVTPKKIQGATLIY